MITLLTASKYYLYIKLIYINNINLGYIELTNS